MKRIGAILCALLLFGVVPASGVTIVIGGDFFADSGGTGIPNGAIVQLVVSKDNDTFGDPTASSFVGEPDDEVILQTTADDLLGPFNAGTASGLMPNRSFDAMFDSGDRLLLRWWPTLTSADTQPGASTAYGQFRPADDVTVTLGSDHAFVVPASESANITLAMNIDFLGNVSNPGGDVSLDDLVYGTTAGSGGGGGPGPGGGGIIPEPSRAVLALGGPLTMSAFFRRRGRGLAQG